MMRMVKMVLMTMMIMVMVTRIISILFCLTIFGNCDIYLKEEKHDADSHLYQGHHVLWYKVGPGAPGEQNYLEFQIQICIMVIGKWS